LARFGCLGMPGQILLPITKYEEESFITMWKIS